MTGGNDGDKRHDEIYQLDLKTNSWVEVGKMKIWPWAENNSSQ